MFGEFFLTWVSIHLDSVPNPPANSVSIAILYSTQYERFSESNEVYSDKISILCYESEHKIAAEMLVHSEYTHMQIKYFRSYCVTIL